MTQGTISQYEQQGLDFLTRHNLEFRAVLIGSDCPLFCEDAAQDKDMELVDTFPRRTHIHGKHYRCTIAQKGKGHFSIDFWNSYKDEEQNYFVGLGWASWHYPALPSNHPAHQYKGKKKTRVTAYDVLTCLTKSDPGTFQDFCMEYGYEEDSRTAEGVWRAVTAEWEKVRKFFTAEQIAELQGIQ